MATEIQIPAPDDDRTLRVVRIDNGLREPHTRTYVLHTWDTYRIGQYGRSILGYAFGREGEAPIFVGDDFSPPAGVAIDSDDTLRSLLGFLTLRPGDTDADYFAEYTDAQLAFADGEAEALQLWGHETQDFADGVALTFVDVGGA